MKKIIGLVIMILLIVSCKEDIRKIAREKAINSGVQVDTVMFDVCFNDSPIDVRIKLYKAGYINSDGIFEYRFKDKRIKGLVWEWDPTFSFHNDSLVSFQISSHSTISYGDLEVLREIYSVKYGDSIRELSSDDESLFWYKGNLEIEIRKYKYGIRISYNNLVTNRYKQGSISDDNHNSYSEEYWNLHYKDKKEEELRKITEDI